MKKAASAAISAKKKRKPRGKPLEPGNIWRWPKGVSGNPSGRPATVSGAYKAWLELPYDKDPSMTNAQALAMAQGHAAQPGDVAAAREIRQATEGDKTTNTSTINVDDIVPLLQAANKLREGA